MKKIVRRISAVAFAAAAAAAPVGAPVAAASEMDTDLTPPPPGTEFPYWDEAQSTQWAETPVVRPGDEAFGDPYGRGLKVLGQADADTAVCAYSKPGRGACFVNGEQAAGMGYEYYSVDKRVSAFAPVTRPVLDFYGAAKQTLSSHRY